MGVHGLGKKHLRRLSHALGMPVYRAYLIGHDPHARCFVDRVTVALVDYKTLDVIAPPTDDHPYGAGWHEDDPRPPNPLD